MTAPWRAPAWLHTAAVRLPVVGELPYSAVRRDGSISSRSRCRHNRSLLASQPI
jgi:hypothetical protein